MFMIPDVFDSPRCTLAKFELGERLLEILMFVSQLACSQTLTLFKINLSNIMTI
jgi:hypothetical protein